MINKETKIKCIRKLWFCCGHRIVGHENKCANAHGHNYTLYVHAAADHLDNVGRVVDFSHIKEKIGDWLDKYWDHTFIIYEKDQILMPIKESLSHNREAFVAPFNPTAENMANYLIHEICPKLMKNTGITITELELCESENNKVVVSLI